MSGFVLKTVLTRCFKQNAAVYRLASIARFSTEQKRLHCTSANAAEIGGFVMLICYANAFRRHSIQD